MKRFNTSGIVTAVLGLLIVITPIVFPVCQGLLELVNGKQVPMRCHWTARAEMIFGALLMVLGLMIAFLKEAGERQRLHHQVALLGLVTILTPLFIIPTCMNPEMSCNVGTKPALVILGALVLITGLLGSRKPKTPPEITT
jgi:peptidoglycan/LPS O-acetylase OafA/YrhL